VNVLLLLAVNGISAAVVVYLWRAKRRKAAQRALARMPDTPIAAVKDGENVRIKGRAIARAPLRTSPISQRDCIGFRLTVDYREGGEGPWLPAIDWEQFDSFLLADQTGEAVLNAPFDIRVDPYDARTENLPPALFDLMEREGVPRGGPIRERHFRFAEILLVPGDDIAAIGRATVELDPGGRSPSHREPPIARQLKGIHGAVVIEEVDGSVSEEDDLG
jgi:hypothetical protein